MQLLHIDNYTPFEWFAFEKMGPGKRLFDIVIVKAAYSLVLDGAYYQIAPFSDEVLPVIHMSDQSHGFNAGAYASIQFAGDAVLYKPGTDFFIVGDAIGPEAKTAAWAAEINIKTKEKKIHPDDPSAWEKALAVALYQGLAFKRVAADGGCTSAL